MAAFRNVMVQFPLVAEVDLGTAYQVRHLQVHLSKEEAETFKRLRTGLAAHGARLQSGRYVQSAPEAIRYILEQFKDGLEKP